MLPLMIELRRSTVPDDLERLQPREQVAEDRLELDPRDVRAHAEVLTEAEREVRVRAAIDAERERIVEHLLVAVRRREVERDLLAGADRRAPHLAVLGGGAGEVADRADPAQDLLDRVGQQLGLVAQLLPLVAVLGEREQPAADRVARRLVARLDEELAVRDELLLGERLRRRSRRGSARSPDRLAGSPRRCVDQLLEVGVQLAARPLDRLRPGVSPGRRYSGSSLPITSLVQRNSSSQSSFGTPRIQAITPSGNGAAMRSTKSSSPDASGRSVGVVEDLDRDALDVVALARAPRAA